MKQIIYLHGLESQQGGQKVEYLSDKGYVFAPEMDYKLNPDLFQEILEEIKELGEPDLIIGSSMGGYFAYMLASHFENVEVILFNPALKERSVEFRNVTKGKYKVKGTLALSEKDRVVDPKVTLQHLDEIGELENFKIEEMKNIGHQVPIYSFRGIYNKHSK
tara:strand:+ start:266 stop:751 length:486 start_codon:yes stop_codon:yes gene_type:complete